MQILVLAMHRSGTSIVTRLINMMGVYLGPEDKLMPAKPDNPKGFWEIEDVKDLNERILKAGGGSWWNVVDFSWERIDERARADFVEEIRHIVDGMEARRPWVIKDPRMCVTLPLWREVLEAPICVHVHRSPLDIASSLQRRNGFSISMGLGLWELYTLRALEASSGLSRIVVQTSNFFHQPVQAVRQLHSDLQACGARGLLLPSEQEISAFIDPSVFHGRELAADPGQDLNKMQYALGECLNAGTDLSTVELVPSAGGIEAQKIHIEAQRIHIEAQRRDARLHTLEQQLRQSNSRERGLEAKLKASESRERELMAETGRLKAGLESLSQNLATSVKRAASLEAEQKRLRNYIGTLETSVRQLAADIGATEQSWRWRTGDGAIRLVEMAMFRPKARLAMDRIHETLQAVLQHRNAFYQDVSVSETSPASPGVERARVNREPIRVVQFTPANPRNPFFSMVGTELKRRGLDFVYSTDRNEVRKLVKGSSGTSLVHFHQLEPFYHPGLQTESAVARRADGLLEYLQELKVSGAKLVWTKHNPVPHDRTFAAVDRSFESRLLSLTDRVVVLAEGAKDFLSASLVPERITVIRHPSYRAYYGEPISKVEARAKLQLPRDAFIFGNIGEIKPYKGLEHIIEAFKLYSASSGGKGLFLLLAGNPGPSEYVERLKREMPENGLLVATDIPDADIPVWMSALDAAVFAFEDIWVSGSVLLALSYERPAIVPQVGFLDEYIDYESTGLLYRHGDLDAMAQAMSAMVGSPYKAHFEYMCRASEKKSHLPLIANLYQKMYEDVIRPE